MRRSIQSLLIPVSFLSMLNIGYTILVVVFLQSWLPTWHLDRRFPFSMVPLWAFCLISIIAWFASVYYIVRLPNFSIKLGFDKVNVFFIYMAFGLFVWILIGFGLIHTYYIGDFYVMSIIQNIFTGRGPSPDELSREDIDAFPTLGDTVIIAYLLLFIFLYLVSWRAIKAQENRPE